MSVINIMSFIIFHISLLKMINVNAKIHILEQLFKTDHKDIQIKTEEFKGEPIPGLHFMIRGEQPKVFKQPTLISLLTLQEQMPNDKYPLRL